MGLGTDSQHDSRAPPAAAAACSPRPRSQLSILSPTESVKTDGQIFRNPKRGAWTQHSTVSALICCLFLDFHCVSKNLIIYLSTISLAPAATQGPVRVQRAAPRVIDGQQEQWAWWTQPSQTRAVSEPSAKFSHLRHYQDTILKEC